MMDERGKYTEATFMSTLKKEYGFVSYPENISMVAAMLDSSVYSGNWDPSVEGRLIEPVFTINNKEYTQKDLADFIVKTKRYNRKENFASIVNKKCDELIYSELLNQEKKQLEEKYPDFRYLMEEYHDGILLFNIMDNKVWSKAVNDTAGLRAYYGQHVNDYNWLERADVSIYTLKDQSLLKSITKLAGKRAKSKWTADELVKMICPVDTIACVEVSDQLFEKGENQPLGGFDWKKGFTKTVQEGKTTKLLVVNALLPPTTKTFNEIQGQVTADYQNLLDKQWIETLRSKYPVVINSDVLKLVK
jgi:peptidyl-prolyl cis-trans isomerase SurA